MTDLAVEPPTEPPARTEPLPDGIKPLSEGIKPLPGGGSSPGGGSETRSSPSKGSQFVAGALVMCTHCGKPATARQLAGHKGRSADPECHSAEWRELTRPEFERALAAYRAGKVAREARIASRRRTNRRAAGVAARAQARLEARAQRDADSMIDPEQIGTEPLVPKPPQRKPPTGKRPHRASTSSPRRHRATRAPAGQTPREHVRAMLPGTSTPPTATASSVEPDPPPPPEPGMSWVDGLYIWDTNRDYYQYCRSGQDPVMRFRGSFADFVNEVIDAYFWMLGKEMRMVHGTPRFTQVAE